MDVLETLVGKDIKTEKEYFDALWDHIQLHGKPMVLGQLLERSAHLFADHVALIWQDQQITYQQLHEKASAFTSHLQNAGIAPRDRILLFIENSIEFYIAYFGIVQAGAVIAPLNIFLQENELHHIIHDCQAAALVTTTEHAPRFTQFTHHLKVFTEFDIHTSDNYHLRPIMHMEPDEMAALLYTSGTTGLPKGVMLSSRNIMTNIIQSMARFNFRYPERLLGILPLFHSFAQNSCVWTALFSGSSVIIIPKIERRYILEGLSYKPTIVLGVPALYGLFCLMKNAPFDSVRYFVSGGDALPDRIAMAFKLLYRRKICNGYGLTEASPVLAADFDDVNMLTSCIGKPVVHVEVAIIDDAEHPVEQGAIGQLIAKGANIMLGYYNAPDQTAQTIKNGWLYTGDLAYIDQQGKIIITGRAKDLIIHKGFNIYPQEIENVIMSYPAVLRVGVVGKPDDAVGQIVIAFVQVRAMEKDIEAKLKKVCQQQLATYKIPKDFIVSVHELPLTATGKVDKKVLRKQLVADEKN